MTLTRREPTQTSTTLETLMRLLDDYEVMLRRIYNARVQANAMVLEQRRRDIRKSIEVCARGLLREGYDHAMDDIEAWAAKRRFIDALR